MSLVSRCTHRLKDWIVLKKFKNETLRLVKFCKKALWWFLFCCITVDWWDDRIFLSAITPVYFFSHTRRRQPPTLQPLQKSYKVNTQVQFGLLASKMAFQNMSNFFCYPQIVFTSSNIITRNGGGPVRLNLFCCISFEHACEFWKKAYFHSLLRKHGFFIWKKCIICLKIGPAKKMILFKRRLNEDFVFLSC